ncbi:MAG: hypothetical protein ACRDXB_14600, partial [Actinomycetes bacterium]
GYSESRHPIGEPELLLDHDTTGPPPTTEQRAATPRPWRLSGVSTGKLATAVGGSAAVLVVEAATMGRSLTSGAGLIIIVPMILSLVVLYHGAPLRKWLPASTVVFVICIVLIMLF